LAHRLRAQVFADDGVADHTRVAAQGQPVRAEGLHVDDAGVVEQEAADARGESAVRAIPGEVILAELLQVLLTARQIELQVLLDPQGVADQAGALLLQLLPVQQPEQADDRQHEQADGDARRSPVPGLQFRQARGKGFHE
jgi:hypothetical protein